MAALRRLFEGLRLRVNEAKSEVAPATQRQFLGFSLWDAKGPVVRRCTAPKAMSRMKDSVRQTASAPSGGVRNWAPSFRACRGQEPL